MIGIYKLYWDNNNYYYYGQSVNISRRYYIHNTDMIKTKHKNKKIQSVFNKYGKPKLEIVELCAIEELDIKEQFYLDLHVGKKWCCNLLEIASSSKGYKHSKETIEKNRLSHLNLFDGDKNPFYGKKHTQESKDKISTSKIGKNFPNISASKKGKTSSTETKLKLSNMRKYDGSYKAKCVLDTRTGVFYTCCKEVADLYGINYSTLRSMLNGRKPNCTQWIYA